MIIKTVAFALMWLNAFLLVGGSMAYNQGTHYHLPSEAYAKFHDDPDLLNVTNVLCTTPGICLGPTVSSYVSYKFLNLDTLWVIECY